MEEIPENPNISIKSISAWFEIKNKKILNKMKNILLLVFFMLFSFISIGQNKNWNFKIEISNDAYYELEGKIADKYPIYIRYEDDGSLCGAENQSPSWQNRGIRGYYYYEKTKLKIPLIGYYYGSLGYKLEEFKLFVPNYIFDTIKMNNCEFENYKEVFVNPQNYFKFDSLLWKMKGGNFYPVSLKVKHNYSIATSAIINLNIFDINYFSFDLSKNSKLKYIDDIIIRSSKEINGKFYVIFEFGERTIPGGSGGGQCGCGYENYLGYLAIKKDFSIEKFEYHQIDSCYKNIEISYKFDEKHPEYGLKILH